jgi:lipopolysaccharide biosynthesis regulator YciM
VPSAAWTAGLLAAGFLLGWAAWAALSRRRGDEARSGRDFDRLFSSAITHLIAGRTTEAIEELTRAARLRTDVLAVYIILGDLYRDRGQFDRAVRIHASLLHRTDLGRTERAHVLTSLGEDYRTAGLTERARDSFRQALDLDARSLTALKGLLKFEIEERAWAAAAEHEEQILRLDPNRSGKTLAFIHYEMGLEALRSDDERAALRAFQKAAAVDERAYPALLFLGDLHHKDGRAKKAVESWERIVDLKPGLLHLVYDRLEQIYAEIGEEGRLDHLCHRIAEKDPADWRVRVLLARRENERGNPEAAYRHLLEAARIHPGSVTVQRELWRMALQRGPNPRIAREMADLVKGPDLFADPYVCATCRFRAAAYLWRCPQCHEWDTFTDETAPRAAPPAPAGPEQAAGPGTPGAARPGMSDA